MESPHGAARRRGFTLVELLVVISVIVILAALVLPVASSAMKTAARAECTSNLHQVAEGFMIYVKEHRGLMPPSGSPNRNPPHRFPHWCRNLEPLVQNPDIFRCPSKRKAEYGYGLNHMWCGPDHIFGRGAAMNDCTKQFDQVTNTAGTVIICDTGFVTNKHEPQPEYWVENDKSNANGCTRYPYDNTLTEPGDFIWWHKDPRRPVPRHTGAKTNCLFFDGHVDAFTTRDIVDDLWDEPDCIYDNDGHPRMP